MKFINQAKKDNGYIPGQKPRFTDPNHFKPNRIPQKTWDRWIKAVNKTK